jgi:hypothetical protein
MKGSALYQDSLLVETAVEGEKGLFTTVDAGGSNDQ